MPTTHKGRIVYERKPHLFTYKDVLRIVRKVEAKPADKRSVEEVSFALAAASAAFADYVRGIRDLAPDIKPLWAFRGAMTLLSLLQDISSQLSSAGGVLLQRTINSLVDRLNR